VSFDYAEIAQVAHEILAEFGSGAVLTKTSPGDYDPDAGAAQLAPINHDCTAVVLPYDDRHIDGTLILRGDKQAMLSAVSLTAKPAPGDMLAWAGTRFRVIAAEDLAPAGVSVLFTLQVRA
jgi:hypothetical protein